MTIGSSVRKSQGKWTLSRCINPSLHIRQRETEGRMAACLDRVRHGAHDHVAAEVSGAGIAAARLHQRIATARQDAPQPVFQHLVGHAPASLAASRIANQFVLSTRLPLTRYWCLRMRVRRLKPLLRRTASYSTWYISK